MVKHISSVCVCCFPTKVEIFPLSMDKEHINFICCLVWKTNPRTCETTYESLRHRNLR